MGLLMTNLLSFSAESNMRENRVDNFISIRQGGLLILVKNIDQFAH